MICKNCKKSITYRGSVFVHTRESPLALRFCLNELGKFYRYDKRGQILCAEPKKTSRIIKQLYE